MREAGGHIEARGLTKVFRGAPGGKGIHALGPLDLDVRSGEFFSIVGPSGCGKSTLLDTLAGLSSPTDGTVACNGVPLAGRGPPGGRGLVPQAARFALPH